MTQAQRGFPQRPRPGQPQAQPAAPEQKGQGFVPQADLKKIIIDGDAEALVKWADHVGSALQKLATSQIRGIFSTVRSVEMNWPDKAAQAQRELRLLKPKLAYQGARVPPVQKLAGVLIPAIDMVLAQPEGEKRRECFQHFVEFFEAILAYHRAYGGSE